MKNHFRQVRVVALLLLLVLLVSACTSAPLPPLFYISTAASQPAQPANPTPAAQAVAQAPVAEPTVAPTEEPTAVPTVAPTEEPTATSAPTDTPTLEPTATSVPPIATATRVPPTATRVPPTATPRPARAAATATPAPEWPQTITITEAEVEELAASGDVPGLTITGLDVTFGDDTMTVFFSSLKYGFISMRNVTVEGHFDVSNGVATFVADSIDPRNLATTQIPGFVNQALGTQFSQWYVEDITITPGELSASVRPQS